MTPTKEQQAQEYAEKYLTDICLMMDYEEDKQIGYFHTYDIQQAYSDGYTACEQSMWRSVEEELPEENTKVVAHSPNGRYDVLKFHDGIFIDELGQQHCVDFYIILPSLPDTNTEKK